MKIIIWPILLDRKCARQHEKINKGLDKCHRKSAPETSSEDAHGQREPARMSWARLLKRVFDIDVEHCPNCGGALKIIACPEARRRAAIEDPPVITKILSHLGLSTRAPPRAPARRVDLFQTI
jgi:hypothetical protein